MIDYLGFGLIALAFLMSGHYPPWQAFEQQAIAGVGALLLGLAVLCRPSAKLSLPMPAAFAALLAVVPLIQHAAGLVVFRSDAALAASYLAGFAVTVIVGRALSSQDIKRFVDGLMAALLVAAIVSTAIALVQWFNLKWTMLIVDLRPGDRPYGNLAQANHLATLLALGLVACIRFFEQRRFGFATTVVLATYLGWGLVMTQSRTTWCFVVLLVVWAVAFRRRLQLRLSLPALVAGVAAFVIATMAWGPLNDALFLTPQMDLEARMASRSLRLLHWQTLADAALRSPWFGYGWGQVVHAQQAAILDHPGVGEWVMQSHNLVLDLLLYNGLPLGILCVVAILWWLVRQIRSCRTLDQWTLLAGIGTVLLHALFEYPLDYLYFLLPVALMVGALESLGDARPLAIVPRPAMAIAVVAVTGMLGWVCAEYLEVQQTARQLRFVMAGIGVDKVPTAPEPQVWLLDEPRAFHRYWHTRVHSGMSEEELNAMRNLMMREPKPPAMLRYAWAAGINGRAEEAAVVLGRLCKLHPAFRCDEGRQSWALLAKNYDVLTRIAYPDTPPELRAEGKRIDLP